MKLWQWQLKRTRKQILNFSCPVQFYWISLFSVCENPYKFPYEKILNRPITEFYNGDDINVIAAKLRLTKPRPTSFRKEHQHMKIKFWKLNVKNKRVCIAYCKLFCSKYFGWYCSSHFSSKTSYGIYQLNLLVKRKENI